MTYFNLLALVVVMLIGISMNDNVHVNALVPKTYDLSTAIALTKFSAISYCNDASVRAWACSDCDRVFRNIQVYSNLYQKTFVADNNRDSIVVVFQGTNAGNLNTWVQNLNADLVTPTQSWCSGCELHRGFLTIHNILFPLVQQDLSLRLRRLPNANVYFVGHSLGGALASLMSFDLIRTNSLNGISSLTVYTYGAPRVGNKNFATAFNRQVPNTWRIVDHADIVPHVPPAAFTSYYSCGTLVYCPVTNTKECKIMSGAEDDGSWTHFSISDHALYLGVKIGTSAAQLICPDTTTRFMSIPLRGETRLLNLETDQSQQQQQKQQKQLIERVASTNLATKSNGDAANANADAAHAEVNAFAGAYADADKAIADAAKNLYDEYTSSSITP